MARKTKRFIEASNSELKHDWLIEMYLEYLRAEGKTSKTLKNYESDLRIFFTWYEENATLKGKAKGFEKTVAVIGDNNVSVIVKSDGLTTAQTLQIQDIITSETKIPLGNIKIVAVK